MPQTETRCEGREISMYITQGQPLHSAQKTWAFTPDIFRCLQLCCLHTLWTYIFHTPPCLFACYFHADNTLIHLVGETYSFVRTNSEIPFLVKPWDIPTAAHRRGCPLHLLFLPPCSVTVELTPCRGMCLLTSQPTVSSFRETPLDTAFVITVGLLTIL